MKPANDNCSDSRLAVQLTVAELRQIVRDELAQLTVPSNVGRWVDVSTAAQHFGCTPATVRNWIRAGAPARQVGTSAHPSYRIDLDEFNEWAQHNHQQKVSSK